MQQSFLNYIFEGVILMKNFIAEFKKFIMRGNVMDMAVGIIIGGAFTAIVTSLVNDIIMPIISAIFGGLSFEAWNIALGSGEEPPMLNLGTFVAAIINFLLIALVIFLVIKAINKMREKPEEEPAAPTTKKCPLCLSEIPIEAKRCACCTADLTEFEEIKE